MKFLCISLDCRENRTDVFESNEKHPACPHCGYTNAIRKIPTIHLLVRDKDGPVRGDGANYRIACGKKPVECAHATGEESAANCLLCLAAIDRSQIPNVENLVNG